MNFSKLKKLHIIIIGSVLCVIAIVGQYFLLIKPKQEAYKVAEGRYQTAVVLGNEVAKNKAIDDRNKAILKVAQIRKSLEAEMVRRMPDLSFARRDLGMLQLWNEQIKTLGPLLVSFAHDPGVTSVSGQFSIPTPPLNPNDKYLDQDPIVIPLGNVQVQGSSFKSVLNNIRRWNNCRRLVMVGPSAISGNTPRLWATYNLTCYIYPDPTTKVGPPIQMAGGGGGTQP